MTTKATTKTATAAKTTQAVEPPASTESEFYIHELQEHSRTLFGVRPEVFNGALLHYKSNKITKTEAKRLIRAFLTKEVK
ncbi:hypothetical protein [Terribacillus saccharophilus]|uniref:hypothetical protein n=1 Tax=Terribacillus saccharophilus TaxID=361277 RepID=UPI001140FB52